MMSMNRDKNLSGTLIFLTLGFIFYAAGSDGDHIIEGSMTLKESILNIFDIDNHYQYKHVKGDL